MSVVEVIGIFLVLIAFSSLFSWLETRRLNTARALRLRAERLQEEALELDKAKQKIQEDREEASLELDKVKQEEALELDKAKQKIQEDNEAVRTLAEEKSQGFPWLGTAYAQYFYLRDMETADYLEHKSHPARRSAERVREIARHRRRAEKAYRVLKYQLEYYENLFPWLVDFKGEDLDDLIEKILGDSKEDSTEKEGKDPARKWLTEAEYSRLATTEKFQLALDRFWQKKKSKWEIGRDYERYVGFLFERDGYQVSFQGIIKGLADLGRDLIVQRDGETQIVQCKCWSKYKTIHEKHIFQLFGTTVEYWLKQRGNRSPDSLGLSDIQVGGTFVTSTVLSDPAREFASVLGISVRENFPLVKYPSVKCNISGRTREKIFHLPFDQQYDTTRIEEERNECYVETVAEAESRGFRRAFRWKGGNEGGS